MDKHRIENPYSGETVAERRFLGDAEVEGLVTRAFRARKGWAQTPIASGQPRGALQGADRTANASRAR
jgi:acyl-CoA reductase-like NAD-dependent aldehyde dehydrogenase